MLGHAFIELRSPLFPQGIFIGMRSASRKEQKDLVLEQHYGLSILGADTEGKFETDIDLEKKVNKFYRKGQLAFMTFYISDEAAERMIRFFQSYKAGPLKMILPDLNISRSMILALCLNGSMKG